jgi:hypothetical protein
MMPNIKQQLSACTGDVYGVHAVFQQPSIIVHSSVFWHVWTIYHIFQKAMTVLQVYITELLCNLNFAGVKGYCARRAILFCKTCIKIEFAYALTSSDCGQQKLMLRHYSQACKLNKVSK